MLADRQFLFKVGTEVCESWYFISLPFFLVNHVFGNCWKLFNLFCFSQIVIDSCCATFAEVQKRGKDFWAEFELYAADLLVGVVVNVALVALLAPYARIGQPPTSKGLFSRMARAYGALPSR